MAMLEPADFGPRHDSSGVGQIAGACLGRVLAEREVRSRVLVQVDNATPIVLSLDKSVIRGIRGAVGLSRCYEALTKGGQPGYFHGHSALSTRVLAI